MILADTNWSRLIAARLEGDEITAADLGPWSADNLAAALGCNL